MLDNGGDFAGGNALNIHLGQGEQEGLFAANTLLESGGIELQTGADLRHLKGDRANPCVESFGFETIGVALAGFGPFKGLRLEHFGPLASHGFVDEQSQALREAVVALGREELQDGG